MSLIAKKAFCSWLCPVGTFSEDAGAHRQKALPPQSSPSALARHSAARPQIPAARLLRLHHRRHVRGRHRRLHAHALRPHRRRQDAQLLPRNEQDSGHRSRRARHSVHPRRELLVPLSLPLRRAHGLGLAVEPAQNSPRPYELASTAPGARMRARRLCPSKSW